MERHLRIPAEIIQSLSTLVLVSEAVILLELTVLWGRMDEGEKRSKISGVG